ncbi:MAG: SDR family NAD(P)-dependent oxidoreductase [Gammaproteobacteria bacterium]|jgi:short-subunit dehydrogenase
MLKNELALITGATSGIGAVYARKLAGHNYDLILTGRRKEQLNSLAQELISKHSIKVETVIAELSDDADLEMLTDKIKNLPDLSMLINNAGFLSHCDFVDGDINLYENMVQTHILAIMKFTHAALQNMKKKNAGSIINVSSIGSYYPYPQSSVYCATKAFISIFTETIAMELKDTAIRIQSLCPGMTATDIFERIGEDIRELSAKRNVKFMSAEDVVYLSFEYLKENRVVCIPGDHNQLLVWQRATKRLL